MKHARVVASSIIAVTAFLASSDAAARERWSPEQARKWDEATPWLVGANYTPAYAINQLEMWQAESFDPKAIDRELGWAQELGFTSMRVFLHHKLWEQDREGFLKRIDQFLAIADKHDIGVMLVLFDSVWDPHPKLGKQREPQKGLHNSGWVQSPGADDLLDPSRHKLLEEYVRGVVTHFKDDDRVQVWDLWNEPDNTNGNSYGKNKLNQEPADKVERTLPLLKQSFAWARESEPSQPTTSGVWIGNWADPAKLSPTERVQLEESDIISFHTYDPLPGMKKCVENLRRYDRPILCTEYMARPRGSTFDPHLGYMKEEGVGAYCWGFVAGKSNTIYPWDSWQKPYDAEPEEWFHDIFREDGSPYRPKEVEFIKSVTKNR
ncbi:MAG: cellulase family glycosylhydrolase [Planctomycetaceae bacterium]|nr:cellulase family glycosylhydrolase [Planctomycetaceae bacterium]